MTPTDILEHLLRGMDFQPLETTPVCFHCGCNTERAGRVMLTLGEDELRTMIETGESGEAHCHFCGRRHTFAPEELAELLAASQGRE